MILGLDLGNRYVKVFSENYMFELFVAWREVQEEEYNAAESSESIIKVIYSGKYILFGEVGNSGISKKNKGDEEIIEYSNMAKLVAIAKYLKSQNMTIGEVKIVTGTPYDDYEKNKKDYGKLMLSGQDKEEKVIVDGLEYMIRVTDVEVTKQGACVILTLPERKTQNYLIWDFGGETLDVSFFENGTRITGLTIPFSLNRLLVDLGKILNNYIDIHRPSLLDARYQKAIENLIFTGKYKNIAVISIEGRSIPLDDYVHEFLQQKTDKAISDTVNELDLNRTDLDSLTNIFVGGGSKLLERELTQNKILANKKILENPQFANVRAYYKIGKVKWA